MDMGGRGRYNVAEIVNAAIQLDSHGPSSLLYTSMLFSSVGESNIFWIFLTRHHLGMNPYFSSASEREQSTSCGQPDTKKLS
jgi:hypothetical protein